MKSAYIFFMTAVPLPTVFLLNHLHAVCIWCPVLKYTPDSFGIYSHITINDGVDFLTGYQGSDSPHYHTFVCTVPITPLNGIRLMPLVRFP